jgi:Domain of unknown function (DUF4349)
MKFVLSIALTFVFLFSGCSGRQADVVPTSQIAKSEAMAQQQGQQAGSAAGDSYQMKEPTFAQAIAAPPASLTAAKYAEEGKPSEPVTTDRKVIQNGEFTIETKTPTEDQNKIAALATSLSGFVVTSEYQQSASQTNSTVSLIIRVPAANFQKATDALLQIGTRVLHKKVTGQDVTAEYIDIEARLRAKKALEAQYFEIMKRAGKISEVLEVQEKLTEVRTEIEQAEGRHRYLENQSALSTITISLQTAAPIVAATQTGFFASIKNSFGEGVDVTVNIVLGIIHFVIVMLPVVVLILLPAGLIARLLWKRVSWSKKEAVGIVPPTE